MVLSPETAEALRQERAELIPFIAKQQASDEELHIARQIVASIDHLLKLDDDANF